MPRTTVEPTFDYVTAHLATQKNHRVERPDPHTLVIHHRYTPGWAIVLGILGLLLVLLGLLFFLVKSTQTATVLGREENGGASFTATGASSWEAVSILRVAFDLPADRTAPKKLPLPPRPEVSATEVAAAGASSSSSTSVALTEQLAGLADLHKQGALTDDEFQAAKARLLTQG